MKQNLIRLSLFLLFLFFGEAQTRAQSPSEAFKKLSSVPLQSPQTASIAKYVEFPVSYYNGLAQISIPIYEVKSGDISVPITLSYHGGGIKVTEEASWVGLGFNLNVGGMISHDIKGQDDDYGSPGPNNLYYPTTNDIAYNENYDVVNLMGCYENYPTPIYYQDHTPLTGCYELLQTLGMDGGKDTEKDLYLYNFGSYSGKFFQIGSGYVDAGRNNIIFTRTADGFSASTPDGFTYTFTKKETSLGSVPHVITTAYYLTQIKSPTGKVVTFQYKTLRDLFAENGPNWYGYTGIDNVRFGNSQDIPQMPTLSEQYGAIKLNWGGSQGAAQANSEIGYKKIASQTFVSTPYLDRIVFDNGYVSFSKSGRNDLYGAKLNAINVHRTDNSLIKSIPFSYDYFYSTTGDDLFDPSKVNASGVPLNYPLEFRQKRLKLLSAATGPIPHSFEYYEGDFHTTLPCKTSFSQDYWGYYNGKFNSSLIPDYDSYNLQISVAPQLQACVGGDRNPDAAFTTAASLKKINYPTKGHTEFVYEKNTFDNQLATQLEGGAQVNIGGVSIGGPQVFYFTIGGAKYLDIWGGLHCNGMNENWNSSSTYNCGCAFCLGSYPNEHALYAMIEKVDPNTNAVIAHYINWEFDISKDAVRNANGWIDMKDQLFEAGKYKITVNYPVGHNPPGNVTDNRRAELYVSYYDGSTSYSNPYGFGVGIRIKSIKHFDPSTQKSLNRNFTYEGGKMMSFPRFCWTTLRHYYEFTGENMGNSMAAEYTHYYLYNSPNRPYSFSANGSLIGYDKVTETLSDGSVGRTEFVYKNRPDKFNIYAPVGSSTGPLDQYLPGVPTTGFLDNGLLQKVSVYDKNNNLLKETINEQIVGLANTYWQLKYRSLHGSSDQASYFQYLKFNFYPVQVGKLHTQKTTEKDYVNGIIRSTSKEYQYNNKGLLSQEKLTGSDGTAVTTYFSYVSDYTGVTSGWIKDLKDKNFIGVPLEVLSKKNNLVTGGSFTTYSVSGSMITPSQMYRIETASPQNIASTSPTGNIPPQFKLFGTIEYDVNGNIKQSWTDKNVYTSYLWGYNNAYPVAQVTGADYATIRPLANQNVLNNPQSTEQQIQNELAALRSALAGTMAQVTSYTYKPLVGVSSQTDPNGKSIYYEYDAFGRLAYVRDHNKYILKKFCYNYQGEYTNCDLSTTASWWQATGITRCKPCPSNGNYNTNIQEHEEKDMNTSSYSYGAVRWILDGVSGNCSSPSDWQNTNQTRCKASSTTGEVEQEQRDMNPCSTTGNQTRWIAANDNCTTCPAPALWQNTATPVKCRVDANSQNTGEQIQEQKDINSCSPTNAQVRWVVVNTNCTVCPKAANYQPTGNYRCVKNNSNNQNTGFQEKEERNIETCSPSYGAIRWVVNGYNLGACPLPAPCDQNCTGPEKKCINGVCETGQYGVVSRQQQYQNGQPICVVYMGYTFSDGSAYTTGSTVVHGICQ